MVLRGVDITKPVLVDYGLSFNDASEDDLTRLNEEIDSFAYPSTLRVAELQRVM